MSKETEPAFYILVYIRSLFVLFFMIMRAWFPIRNAEAGFSTIEVVIKEIIQAVRRV